MNDFTDPLNALWLQQTTDDPNVYHIQQRAKWERRKQLLYTTIDILVLLPLALIALWFYPDMSLFETLFLIGIVSICAVYTGYILWLRVRVIAIQRQSVRDFVTLSISVLALKLRILSATKWSILTAPVIVIFFYVGIGVDRELPIFETVKLLGVALVATTAFCLPFWIWCKRRYARFLQEKRNFESLATQNR
ncbi:hypothetical protein OE749_14295 [Aestuariibacter sp. AA17]|uniref:Uncharacterized protein n=1 Tax=Fluctibacter corallii TaxID=2984329 RepID=A0ABT3AB19_9ALTE|nr:hypothetical protein [Aestuariibacter sp. AA17]MCV2885865.1 hypothetical protein [Aestuariibacter sp. AA17]